MDMASLMAQMGGGAGGAGGGAPGGMVRFPFPRLPCAYPLHPPLNAQAHTPRLTCISSSSPQDFAKLMAQMQAGGAGGAGGMPAGMDMGGEGDSDDDDDDLPPLESVDEPTNLDSTD